MLYSIMLCMSGAPITIDICLSIYLLLKLLNSDKRYQLDATILFIIINISTCFGHLYAHLQEYRYVYYCIWCSALGVVTEVLRSRCIVLCTVCKFVS